MCDSRRLPRSPPATRGDLWPSLMLVAQHRKHLVTYANRAGGDAKFRAFSDVRKTGRATITRTSMYRRWVTGQGNTGICFIQQTQIRLAERWSFVSARKRSFSRDGGLPFFSLGVLQDSCKARLSRREKDIPPYPQPFPIWCLDGKYHFICTGLEKKRVLIGNWFGFAMAVYLF